MMLIYSLADALGGDLALRLIACLVAAGLVIAAGWAGHCLRGTSGAGWAALVAVSYGSTPLFSAQVMNERLVAATLVMISCACTIAAVRHSRPWTLGAAMLAVLAGSAATGALLVVQSYACGFAFAGTLLFVSWRVRALPGRTHRPDRGSRPPGDGVAGRCVGDRCSDLVADRAAGLVPDVRLPPRGLGSSRREPRRGPSVRAPRSCRPDRRCATGGVLSSRLPKGQPSTQQVSGVVRGAGDVRVRVRRHGARRCVVPGLPTPTGTSTHPEYGAPRTDLGLVRHRDACGCFGGCLQCATRDQHDTRATVVRQADHTVAVGQWLAADAAPSDTAVVLWGKASLLHEADMTSPYHTCGACSRAPSTRISTCC